MTRAAPKFDKRQAQLAAIHMAQKKLGLGAEEAAALKVDVTGVASAGDMTPMQRSRYLAHLASLQAQYDLAAGKAPAYVPQRRPQEQSPADRHDERWHKARALWHALAVAGHVRVDTDAALTAYVKRQAHVDHWRFLNTYQANSVIEALKRWCVRTGVPTEEQGK